MAKFLGCEWRRQLESRSILGKKPYRAEILARKTTPAAATDAAVTMKKKNEAPLGQKRSKDPHFVR
jgi:hypothetical protein